MCNQGIVDVIRCGSKATLQIDGYVNLRCSWICFQGSEDFVLGLLRNPPAYFQIEGACQRNGCHARLGHLRFECDQSLRNFCILFRQQQRAKPTRSALPMTR